MNIPEARTQSNFDRLPALLSRSEFLHWTGLSGADLDEGVAAGTIEVWRRPGSGERHRKYFKWQAGRFCGYIDSPQRVLCSELLFRVEQFAAGMPLPTRHAFKSELNRIRTVLGTERS